MYSIQVDNYICKGCVVYLEKFLRKSSIYLALVKSVCRAEFFYLDGCENSDGRSVGERSNFKKNPTHTQDHGDGIATRGEVYLHTLEDR